jgi:hypothetical protein
MTSPAADPYPSAPLLHQSVDALAWLAGSWLSHHDGDALEETWMPPGAGVLLGMFRWQRAGQPRFYELMAIEPDEGRLTMRLKHFNPGLVAWEDKAEAVTFDLVALAPREAVFFKRHSEQRLWTYYRQSEANQLVAGFLRAGQTPSEADEFRYRRL